MIYIFFFCRGDVVSVQMLFDCFQEYSAASGLIANKEKSSIYFGRVRVEDQETIMRILGFTKGTTPFKYLGMSLSTKRLSIIQCQPLLERMLARTISWTTKFLSYARRLMLLKNVLFPLMFSGHTFLCYLRR